MRLITVLKMMSNIRSLKIVQFDNKTCPFPMLISTSQKLRKGSLGPLRNLLLWPLPMSRVDWWPCITGCVSCPRGTPDSLPFGDESNAGLTWCFCQNTQAPCVSVFTGDLPHKPALLPIRPSSAPPLQLPPGSSSPSHAHSPSGRQASSPTFPSGGADSASLTVSLRIDSFTENKQKAPNYKQTNKTVSHFLCHSLTAAQGSAFWCV